MSSLGSIRYAKLNSNKLFIIYVDQHYFVHVYVNSLLKPAEKKTEKPSKFYSHPMRPAGYSTTTSVSSTLKSSISAPKSSTPTVVKAVKPSKFHSFPMRPAAIQTMPVPSSGTSSAPKASPSVSALKTFTEENIQKKSEIVEQWKQLILSQLSSGYSSDSGVDSSEEDSSSSKSSILKEEDLQKKSSLVEQWKQRIQDSLAVPTSSELSSDAEVQSEADNLPTFSGRPPVHLIDFVFAPGVRNAPQSATRVTRLPLENSKQGFEIIVDDTPSKPIKEFSQEELEKQMAILEEWKIKIQDSLRC